MSSLQENDSIAAYLINSHNDRFLALSSPVLERHAPVIYLAENSRSRKYLYPSSKIGLPSYGCKWGSVRGEFSCFLLECVARLWPHVGICHFQFWSGVFVLVALFKGCEGDWGRILAARLERGQDW